MSKKRNAIYTIAIIASIILIFTLADFVHENRLFSETENRSLAQKPKFSKEALLSGEYTEDYEVYVTDQFVSRDKWIRIKTWIDIVFGKSAISGVCPGEDDYLIE